MNKGANTLSVQQKVLLTHTQEEQNGISMSDTMAYQFQ